MSTIYKSKNISFFLLLSLFLLFTSMSAQDAKFKQLSGDDGLVCMEAENYSSMRESAGDSWWELVEEPLEYSGTGAMWAQPAGYEVHKDINDGQENAPVLQYAVEFVIAAPVYVWGRASHMDGYDDSVWFGKDGLIEGTSPLSYKTDEQSYADEWYWIRHLMDENIAILNIDKTGVQVFEIYMREPSFKLDKIVLTTNADYIPNEDNEMGPAETLFDSKVSSFESSTSNGFYLAQNYPNPFNPVTTIEYEIPKAQFVSLQIYNLDGQEITRLVNSYQPAGHFQITWNAEYLPAGIYFYKLQAGEYSMTKKLVLQK